MEHYEISIWEDVYVPAVETGDTPHEAYMDERKLGVIGSDTLTAQWGAVEPILQLEMNDISTFSFQMPVSYIEHGERKKNPYIPLLIPERKLKVFWKNKWYDFIIQQKQETLKRDFISYTCVDANVNELAKTGYKLDFNQELFNNSGTIKELIEASLTGTDWVYDDSSDVIYQKREESVYYVTTMAAFDAISEPLETSTITIPAFSKIGVFYPCVNKDALLQFLLITDTPPKVEENTNLLIDYICYHTAEEVSWSHDDTYYYCKINGITIFQIAITADLPYQGNRYINSNQTFYDSVLNKVVDRYTLTPDMTAQIGKYVETKYLDASTIVQLLSESANSIESKCWQGGELDADINKLYPPASMDSTLYLVMPRNKYYLNTGLNYLAGIGNNVANKISDQTTNGLVEGQEYILRVQYKGGTFEAPTTQYLTTQQFDFNVYDYQLTGNPKSYIPLTGDTHKYFTQVGNAFTEPDSNYVYVRMKCVKSISYEDLKQTTQTGDTITGTGFLIKFTDSTSHMWIEKIEFYKYIQGQNADGEMVRIDPDANAAFAVATPHYVYYQIDNTVTKKDDIQFLYDGVEDWNNSNLIPLSNHYEAVNSIEAGQSNVFNILQTISENFAAWVELNVEHDTRGKIIQDYNSETQRYIPRKKVKVYSQLGKETYLAFRYGIDLQSLNRTIKSDAIVTQLIVLSNANEVADNGFCTIQRSESNYTKDNSIFDFQYYINQGLLSKDVYDTEYKKYATVVHDNNVLLDKYDIDWAESSLSLTIKEADLIVKTEQGLAIDKNIDDEKSYLSGKCGVTVLTDDILADYESKNPDDTDFQRHLAVYNQQVKLRTEVTAALIELNDSENGIVPYLRSHLDELDNERYLAQQAIDIATQNFLKIFKGFIREGTWTSEDYFDDNLYYADALAVSHQSAMPQVTYDIEVAALDQLESFKNKQFHIGDKASVQDVELFGYYSDGITPYREPIIISGLQYNLRQPWKSVITVQNYKNQFDDLFNNMAATVQSLTYAQGMYNKVANIIDTEGNIKPTVIQNSMNNDLDSTQANLNNNIIQDETGIKLIDPNDKKYQTKITAHGILISQDGGETWTNALNSVGIPPTTLTNGEIDTNTVNLVDKEHPTLRWDSYGINAYSINESAAEEEIAVDNNKFVRFDRFGLYGVNSDEEITFVPESPEDIKEQARFGLIWDGLFIKNKYNNGQVEISNENDITVYADSLDPAFGGLVPKVKIGKINESGELEDEYGIVIKSEFQNEETEEWENQTVFKADNKGDLYISGEIHATDEDSRLGNVTLSSLNAMDAGFQFQKNGLLITPNNGEIGTYTGGLDASNETGFFITVVDRSGGKPAVGKILAQFTTNGMSGTAVKFGDIIFDVDENGDFIIK